MDLNDFKANQFRRKCALRKQFSHPEDWQDKKSLLQRHDAEWMTKFSIIDRPSCQNPGKRTSLVATHGGMPPEGPVASCRTNCGSANSAASISFDLVDINFHKR